MVAECELRATIPRFYANGVRGAGKRCLRSTVGNISRDYAGAGNVIQSKVSSSHRPVPVSWLPGKMASVVDLPAQKNTTQQN